MGGTLAQVRVPVTDSQRVRMNSQDERRASAINLALLGFVRRQSPASTDKGFHIGLRYNTTVDNPPRRLVWVDGPPSENVFLLPITASFGDHFGDCIEVSLENDFRGRWFDEMCADTRRPAVCERRRR